MSNLYPFLMLPQFDARPWGARDLSPIYPNHRFEEKIGEAWLTGDASKVANGRLAGRTLSELSQEFGRELVGDAAPDATRFPLLLKFLFPHEKLSVQVHPDDDAARGIGQPCGKTECWYVAHARRGAQIGLGLRPGVTRAHFEEAVHQQRAEEMLNWLDVFPGDLIYVVGGTVHTLGPGAIIVETQQQSDTTYRLYDYGRPRELHLKEGLAVIKEGARSGKVQAVTGMNGHSQLIASPYFVVDRYVVQNPLDFQAGDESGKLSAQILVAVDGCAVVEASSAQPVTLAKGDAVVIPASAGEFRVKPQWQVEFLKSSVPGAPKAEPAIQI